MTDPLYVDFFFQFSAYQYKDHSTSWFSLLFNPFPNKPWFLRDCCTSLSITLGKVEIAHNEQFLLLPQCFLTFCHFYQINDCILQRLSIWKSLKFVVWERVNSLPNDKLLDWSDFKDFADDKINVTYRINFVMGGVENIVEKGENDFYQHFNLFPQCFQKSSLLGLLKVWIVW